VNTVGVIPAAAKTRRDTRTPEPSDPQIDDHRARLPKRFGELDVELSHDDELIFIGIVTVRVRGEVEMPGQACPLDVHGEGR